MSLAETPSMDLGARVVSPLLEHAEHCLPANITAVTPLGGGDRVAFALGDGTVRVRGIAADGDKPAFGAEETVAMRHTGAATALLAFQDGFVSAGQDGKVYRCAGSSSDAVKVFDFGEPWVDALAAHSDKGLIAATATRRLVVVDRNGKPQFEHDAFPSAVTDIAFSPDGRRLAVAHLDGLSIFSAETGAREHLLEWKGSHIGVSWSPDGRYVVSATQERELHVWDLVTLGDLRLGGYPHKIHGMNWLTPGPFLVCTGADVITAWSFADGGPGGKPPIEIGYVYDGLVSAVAANPKRALVAGGYSTGSVLIGGIVKGEALLARASQGDAVTAMAWSPDGTRLIAGTNGGNAIVVDIPAALSVQ
jgi:WD40 repeat protein